jgi:hypothetical protein
MVAIFSHPYSHIWRRRPLGAQELADRVSADLGRYQRFGNIVAIVTRCLAVWFTPLLRMAAALPLKLTVSPNFPIT